MTRRCCLPSSWWTRLSDFRIKEASCLRALDRNPVLYLLAVAMASNVGSTTTITGNPQNMITRSLSHVPYGGIRGGARAHGRRRPRAHDRVDRALPRSLILHRRTARRAGAAGAVHRGLMLKSDAVALMMVALFFASRAVAK